MQFGFGRDCMATGHVLFSRPCHEARFSLRGSRSNLQIRKTNDIWRLADKEKKRTAYAETQTLEHALTHRTNKPEETEPEPKPLLFYS